MTAADELVQDALKELRAVVHVAGAAASVLKPLYERGTPAGDFQRKVALAMVELFNDERLSVLRALLPRVLEAEAPASRCLLELAAEVLLRGEKGQAGTQEGSRVGEQDPE